VENTPVQHRARRILERYKELKTEKQPYENIFDLIDEYVLYKKPAKGEGGFLDLTTETVFDDTAPDALERLASSLKGALWPNGARSIQIEMPAGLKEEIGEETDEVKKYYEFVTEQLIEAMDTPRAGFDTAQDEMLRADAAYGTSGISWQEQDDWDVPVAFRSVNARPLYVEESESGFVNCIYTERDYTLRQLIERFGFENISKRWQDAYEKGDSKTKVKVVHIIEPRMERDPYGFGVANMPYASIHIDMATEKILLESGFVDFPVAVTRHAKLSGEKYGRSPSMKALPSIFEANAIGEAWPLAVEKMLDPPMLVQDDGSLGGGIVDTSPGGMVVVNVSGRLGGSQRPIEPLFTVGDMQWTATRRTELVEVIKNHYFHNVLFDLEQEQRMTATEFTGRNQWRGQALNPVYSRKQNEIYVPTVEAVFNILLRKGKLGVLEGSAQEQDLIRRGIIPRYIPEAVARRMATGQEVYKITFISPAARIMQTEELQGCEYVMTATATAVQVNPEAADNVDIDWLLRRIQQLAGASPKAMRAMESVRKIREDRAKMQQQMAEIQAQRESSETARNMGQAAASMMGTEQQGAA
jgi:hypothetical protein